MKKLSAVLLAFTLVFSSVGSALLFANDAQTVEAKSYKSGKKASTTIIQITTTQTFKKITTMQQTQQRLKTTTQQINKRIQKLLLQTKVV